MSLWLGDARSQPTGKSGFSLHSYEPVPTWLKSHPPPYTACPHWPLSPL